MKTYLRILALLYFFGACLHGLDLIDLRLHFSEMDFVWKAWIVYLFIFDLIASAGLWMGKRWGIATFMLVAISQLFAYLWYRSFFGDQVFLVVFHILTLTLFMVLFFIDHHFSNERARKQNWRIT